MKLVYICGPYTHAGVRQQLRHIKTAQHAALLCATAGVAYFCPHLNSRMFDKLVPEVSKEYYLRNDMRILRACNGVLLLPGYIESQGCELELLVAAQLSLPTFRVLEEPLRLPQELLEWALDCS
jgi:Domain of unknown function (DUF4406)